MGGLKTKLTYPAGSTVNQHDKHLPIFLKQMQDAGIEIEQEPQDFTTWLENYRTLNYTISLGLTQVIESPEFPLNWHQATGPVGDRSFGVGLGDPDIEAALEKTKTKTTLDFKERVQAVRDVQKLLYTKDPTFLPLVSAYGYTAYRKSVHNVPAGIGSTSQTAEHAVAGGVSRRNDTRAVDRRHSWGPDSLV